MGVKVVASWLNHHGYPDVRTPAISRVHAVLDRHGHAFVLVSVSGDGENKRLHACLMKVASQGICGSKPAHKFGEKQIGENSKKQDGQDKEVCTPRIHQSGCQRVAGTLEGADASRKHRKTYEAY
jgi:hypothetical protein